MVQSLGAPGAVTTTTVAALDRLCVSFLDCPTVAKGAANFLVLAENRVQETFEFAAFDLDRMRAELRDDPATAAPLTGDEVAVIGETLERDLGNAGDINAYAERVATAVDLAKRYVANESKRYPDIDATLPQFWIVFTEARFSHEYYLAAVGDDILLVSLGYWRTSMAPPSALEFIVRMTQAACGYFFLRLPVHYSTKGCLLDFNEYIQDARLMVLVGNLCSVCRARASAKPAELAALLKLLDKEWVGDMTTSASVASVLKKVYDYDLYVSRGLSVNRLETFWDTVTSSSAQEFIRIIAAVVLAFLLLKFGLKPGG
ncbi:MAG TPA: hypothetical protein VGC72_18795 [Candidatus Elarobacter sp.]|jgi:hypothetical protein